MIFIEIRVLLLEDDKFSKDRFIPVCEITDSALARSPDISACLSSVLVTLSTTISLACSPEINLSFGGNRCGDMFKVIVLVGDVSVLRLSCVFMAMMTSDVVNDYQ